MEISYRVADFEGPLDLLLHLINRHKLNIHDIPIFDLVEQYIEAVRQMQQNDEMDTASEFVDMASRLIYIKTVSLLPVHDEADELKRELEGELMEYQECKLIAEKLSKMTEGFGYFVKQPEEIEVDKTYHGVHEPFEITTAYMYAVGKGKRRLPPPKESFQPIVQRRIVPVHARISYVMRKLFKKGKMKLTALYYASEDRSELVATFLAILQLARDKKIYIDGDGADTQITALAGENENGNQ
ncbi:MAG: segregation/condensation protein A [Clostridia bacterium]|nr:segregation/condensation protein A [Clostridia bacterium]